jgi:hypothetical protein
VRDVYVAGELVVEDGRSTRVDEAAVAADEVHVAGRLWSRLEATPEHTYDPQREK